ncbi:sensor histidine kinase [Moheibacter sediminis]|uniref:Histidine kinase n=1 Tax=Moheibacter sediminis TaxID=1434700 RepID=A0A1W2C571_9FLAO|nr:histidine kinase [Moheibacter sediminis]SMC80359.1 Histidine kinase [Moheibacter sediminis]
MNKKLRTFFIRLLVIYLWHLMIKWGDETFHDFFDFTTRGILLSFFVIALWMSAVYLLDFIKKLKWFPHKKLIPYILFHIGYGYFFALVTNVVYRYVDTTYYKSDWGDIGYFNPTLTLALTLIFITNVGLYEYFKSDIAAKENEIVAEKLKRENAIAHYKLLKAQIEPHFLFNSLSVLSSLVHKDPYLAEEFILKLSKLMRFAVEQNDKIYVTLEDEMNFAMNYFFLIKTRFGSAIKIVNEISVDSEKYILPPYSLQLLIENTIQHTRFSIENPLIIHLFNDVQFMYISNNFSPKEKPESSTGIGLDNLSKRISHLGGEEIHFEINDGQFKVKIPLILNNSSK